MRSKWLSLVSGVAGALLLVSCGSSTGTNYGGGGGGGGCTPSATMGCTANGSQFNPTTLTVAAGTTVSWPNGDGGAHTVPSATGSAGTYDNAPPARNVSHHIMTARTYHYHRR